MNRARRHQWAVKAQSAAAIAAFIALAMRPPAEGFLLLVPLTSAATRLLPTAALSGGATLVARGPLPGSLIVHGLRDRVATSPGLLVLAAPPAICGGASTPA